MQLIYLIRIVICILASSTLSKSDMPEENEDSNYQDAILNSKNETLNIVFWNGFWNWPFFGMGVGNRGFVANKCQYQNCYTTNQRKKITNKHTRIDAIVVHGPDDDLARLASTNVSRTSVQAIEIKFNST